MKLQTKFIAFTIVIHVVTIGLSFYIFRENKLLFFASEFFIIISMFLCLSLYNEMEQVLINIVKNALEAMDKMEDDGLTCFRIGFE